MEENPNSASAILGSIIGSGGVGSVASGVGDLICGIKGNCAPKNLTVVNQPPVSNGGMSTLLLVGGGLVLVLVMVMVLKG